MYTLNVSKYKDDELFNKAYAKLPVKRREKIDCLKDKEDKLRSLGAGILFHYGMLEQGQNGTEAEIDYGEHGKPYLKDLPGLHFNLSHSGDMAVAAFSENEIGVDVQQMGAISRKLAKRFFSTEEYDFWVGLQSLPIQEHAFYRIWSLKESFLKVTGLGMSLDLTSFSISIRDGIRVTQTVNNNSYQFVEKSMPGYCISVCTQVVT